MKEKLIDKVREKRRNISIFILTLLSGVFGGIFSASLYDYLTNSSQILLCGIIPQALLFMIASGILLVILILIAIFRLMWIPERPDRIFPLKLIYDRKEGIIPVLSRSNRLLKDSGYAFQELSKERPEIRDKVKEYKNLERLSLELIEYLIVTWMSQKYNNWWSSEKYLDTGTEERYKGKNKPSTILKFLDLPLRKENIFFSAFSKYYEQETTDLARNLKMFRITLPENTKFDMIRKIQCNRCGLISYSKAMVCPKCGEKNELFVYTSLTMKNRYCKTSMTISYSLGDFGVSDMTPSFEISEEENVQDINRYLRERFVTMEYLLDFKAQFSRWWSLSPSSDDYHQWVEDMLERLYEDYCWIPFIEEITNKGIKVKIYEGASFVRAFAKI